MNEGLRDMAHVGVGDSPEFRLLAACSWIAPEPLEHVQRERVTSACTDDVPWDRFLRLVNVHGVQSQAYEALRRHEVSVPREVLGSLREQRVRVSARSLGYAAELVRLTGIFTAEGVDLLPLKGVALSMQLYGDPGMRTSGDLDVMVKPAQCDRAAEILEQEGYRCELHGTLLTRKQKEHIRENLYHLEFFNEKSGLRLELHWSIGALWLPEHTGLLWSHTVAREWGGRHVRFLDEDFLLLVLCDHGARHRFCCMKWLGDVARLLALRNSPDCSRLLDLAEWLDLKRTLAHTSLLVHWVYGLQLADGLTSLIQTDPVACTLSRKVLDLMRQPAEASAAQRRGGPLLSLQLQRLRPSIPLHRVLRSAIIAPTDFTYLKLPESLFWLYAPLRPLFWLWRYFKSC